MFLCIQGNVIPGTTHSESKRISADIMYKIQESCVLQVSGRFKPTLAFKQARMGTEISHREAGNQNVNLKNHNFHPRHQFDCFFCMYNQRLYKKHEQCLISFRQVSVLHFP